MSKPVLTLPIAPKESKAMKSYKPLTLASRSATAFGPDLGLPFSFRLDRSMLSCVSDRLGRKGIGVLGRLEMNYMAASVLSS